MSTEEQVRTFLNNKLEKHPATTNSQWYVGIASDPEDRLFKDHKVSKTQDKWAHDKADTEKIARSVEKRFLDAGCDGGPGGGDAGSKFVYVYLKSSRTEP